MASRDMALRDAFHMQLEEYIKPLEAEEYEKFLGVAGDELELLMPRESRCTEKIEGAELMAEIHYISIDEARDIHLANNSE